MSSWHVIAWYCDDQTQAVNECDDEVVTLEWKESMHHPPPYTVYSPC